MKNYHSSGLLLIMILVFSLFLGKGYGQSSDKIKAFNQSIKYESNNDYKSALDVLKKVTSENNSYLFNMRLGWLYYLNEDYKNSKKYYGSALTQSKNSIEAMLGLTLPLASLEEWDEVQNIYVSILKIDANNYYANLRLGQIFLNKGEYSTAKKYLEKMYLYYPSEYEVNLSLGWTYYYLGEKQKAKQLFSTVLMMSENDESASTGLKQLE
ncbi:MAG TPA: tetratricopeptide repeat protein [Ignavibacteriaceae bacterium]|nr:tetratricopeptide repeat protein [Ignavibacteriaceae bacterium]